jgi:hypothetical protein
MNRGLLLSVAFVGALFATAAAEAATSVVNKSIQGTAYCGTVGSNYLVGVADLFTTATEPLVFTITHSNASNSFSATLAETVFDTLGADLLSIELKGYAFRNGLKTKVVRYAMTGRPPAGSTFYGVSSSGVFASMQGTATIVVDSGHPQGLITGLTGTFIAETIDRYGADKTKRCVAYGTLVAPAVP